MFFVLLDRIQLEVTVTSFRNILNPTISQPGHVYVHVSLWLISTKRIVSSTSIGREGPMRNSSYDLLLFSIFLNVDHRIKIALITSFEGHLSDPRYNLHNLTP